MERKRETELDILRIIALSIVILVHSCEIQCTSNISKGILTFILSIITWEIPIYVMISGRFFLDPKRKISSKKIWKSICRLIIAFIVWDVVYQVYYVLSGSYVGLNWKGILSQSIIGPYHFWYLYMLIFLYAITPFLRKIAEDKRMMEYFILLFLLFEFLTSYGTQLPFIGATISDVLVKGNFHFALGYSGYYILGYYLREYKVSDKIEKLLYVLGVVAIIFTGTANTLRTISEGINGEWYSKYLLPNVAIEAIAIYTFFVKRVSKYNFSEKMLKLFTKLFEYSFGVYLIHALVLELISFTGIGTIGINQFLMWLIRICVTFVISIICVAVLRKIPYIGKHIT